MILYLISVYEWQHEEVYQWLYQLSPSLYKLYKPNFVEHDIIGECCTCLLDDVMMM